MAATIKEDAPYREFAERLTKLRTEAGLTRAQLGEKIGVAGRSIINHENGERIPYGDTCVKMAEVFGITTDELLGVENPELEMEKAKQKFTPNKFRTPEWQDRTSTMREAADQVIQQATEDIRRRASIKDEEE